MSMSRKYGGLKGYKGELNNTCFLNKKQILV